jgi:DNA-binding response OmpR family regulator
MARILLIDDDDPLREVLATTLASVGHIVMQAADGKRGVELFRVEPADLVITDIIMPGQEGIETIVALRRELPSLPIIAMSGGTSYSKFYLEVAAKLGAQRTLAKPFTTTELMQAVSAVLATPPAGSGADQPA